MTEINYYICEGCGRKVPDDLELARCPLCGCVSFKSSQYPDVTYSIEESSLINSHWDKGAYKTSIDPKFHKPIKPPMEGVTCILCQKRYAESDSPFCVSCRITIEKAFNNKESEMDANEYCCRSCVYCRRAEFPPHEPKIIQFICKRRTVEGELINQYPDQLDDRLDEEHNWCGDGKWWYENEYGEGLFRISEILVNERRKKYVEQK